MYHKLKTDIQFIGIDWGSNNFRAYAIDTEGNVRQRAKAHQGIYRVKDDNYVVTLKRLLGKWFNKYPEIPVLMCGMIGSADGWQEVDCIEEAATLEVLADYVDKIANHRFERDIYIVPGVRLLQGEKLVDTLRGEEVQALGAALCYSAANPTHKGKQIICLPGMQTKWVEVNNQQIVKWTTFVTGELYSTFAKQTQLNNLITTNIYDIEAINIGLALLQQGNGLLSDIFKLKMMGINGEIAPTAISSALCSLLVGNEFESAIKQIGKPKEISVVGAAWLVELYQEIGRRYDITVNTIKIENASAAGLLKIYQNLPKQQPMQNNHLTRVTIKNHTADKQFSWA